MNKSLCKSCFYRSAYGSFIPETGHHLPDQQGEETMGKGSNALQTQAEDEQQQQQRKQQQQRSHFMKNNSIINRFWTSALL